MTWVKLDESFTDHPKIEAVGVNAAWLFVAGLCYCNRFLTDGVIPKERALRLAAVPSPAKQIAKLLEHGLWEPHPDGYVVHDFLKYQPSKEKVEKEREANAERQRRSRGRRGDPPGDNEGESPPMSHRDSEHDEQGDSERESHPPRSGPSRPSVRPVPLDPVRATSASQVNRVTEDDDAVVAAAIEILAHEDLAGQDPGKIKNRIGYLRTCREERQILDGATLRELAAENPDHDAPNLVAAYKRLREPFPEAAS